MAGAWRAGAALGGPSDPLAAYRDRPLTLHGIVDDAPRCGAASCLFTLRVEAVRLEGGEFVPVGGKVQVRTTARADLSYGRTATLNGELRAPRAVSGYPRVGLLARQGVYEVMEFPRLALGEEERPGSWLEVARAALERRLVDLLPGPEGQLSAGLLLGRDVQLSPELRADLRATGTSHILAVSGFNVALVGGFCLGLAGRAVRRPWALAVALLAVGLYTGLVGAPPSAIRAALMFGLTALAALAGRLPDPLTSLVAAAVVMTAVDPTVAFDLGFQLSFAATAGLVLFGARPGSPRRWVRLLIGALAPTLAAEVATLPLMLWTFHSLSLVAPLTNLLIAPLLPIQMALATATLLGSLVPPLGALLALATGLAGRLTLGIIDGTAHLPFAALATGALPLWALAAAYGCLLVPLALPAALRRGAGRPDPAWRTIGVGLSLVGLVAVGSLASARAEDTGQLRARFFDVAGDGLSLVELPGGQRLLVGSAGSPLAVGAVAEQLPLLDRRIDLLVVTRVGERELAGLGEIVRRYPVGQVLQPPGAGPSWQAWTELLDQRGIPTIPAAPGLVVQLDQSRLEVEDVAEPSGPVAALSARLLAEALDLRLVGSQTRAPAAAGRVVMVRLAPELGLSRPLRDLLADQANEVVVVGGRAGGDGNGRIGQLRPAGGDVVELLMADGEARLERRPCQAEAGPCTWSVRNRDGPP